MKVEQKRVRVIPPAIQSLGIKGPIVLAVRMNAQTVQMLKRLGLQIPPAVNASILPGVIGPITRFNAEGKHLVQKEQPKETAYRHIEWSWEQWNGPYTETVTEVREVPYERYPRLFVPPPSVELCVVLTLEDEVLVATAPFDIASLPVEDVCHRINLMLEIFGSCEVLNENLSKIVQAPITRIRWQLLPKGIRPWNQLEKELEDVIEAQPKGNQGALIYRLKTINDKKPDTVQIGLGGFKDYVVFGFTGKNLYILESPKLDNATYVFGNDWDVLAQLTKSELIAGNLAQARLIHRNDWETQLNNLFE